MNEKILGRFLAPFDTKKGVFQIKPITNTGASNNINKCGCVSVVAFIARRQTHIVTNSSLNFDKKSYHRELKCNF